MKIGIIGANGKAGKIIATQAAERGHIVTAIVRAKEKMAGMDLNVVEKDLFDLTPEDLKGFDAVVSAFGLPFGGDHPDDSYQKAYAHLTRVMEQLPDVRLLVVGGAASLYQDETKTAKVIEMFPEVMRKDPADMAKAFEALQKSKVNYTYFSPACFFEPTGKYTGEYTLGENDIAIKNSSGESFISYLDYGCAMVDEIENGKHIRMRITAVSDSKNE